MKAKDDIVSQRKAYAASFYLFLEKVITPYYSVERNILTERIHKDICDFLQFSRGDGSTRSSNISSIPMKSSRGKKVRKRRKLLLVPRDSLKTTIVIAYVLWRLVHNPKLKVNLSGFNTDRVQSMLLETMGHIERNKLLKKIYGNFCSAKHDGGIWKQTKIQLYDPYRKEVVPWQNVASVTISGLRAGKTGNHVDISCVDDSVCDRNISTDEQLQAPLTHFKYLQPITRSEIIVTGTRYDFRDAYQHLMKQGNYDVYLRSAYEVDGSPWFPEHLDEDYLDSESVSMGPYLFACQYMNNPVHPDEAVFMTAWIDGCLVDRSEIPKKLRVFVYVDPAFGIKPTNNSTAILVVGMDTTGTLWVLQDTKVKMKPDDTVHTMLAHHKEYHAEVLRCEAQVAAVFIEPVLRRMAADLKMEVLYEGYIQSTQKSKPARISALYRLIQTSRIKIPTDCYNLISELTRYQNRKNEEDDLLDVLARAADDLFEPEEDKEPTAEDIVQAKIDFGARQRISHDPVQKGGGIMRLKNSFRSRPCRVSAP